jgi:hypothetical protein
MVIHSSLSPPQELKSPEEPVCELGPRVVRGAFLPVCRHAASKAGMARRGLLVLSGLSLFCLLASAFLAPKGSSPTRTRGLCSMRTRGPTGGAPNSKEVRKEPLA